MSNYVTNDRFDAAMTAIKQDFNRVDDRFDELREEMHQGFERILNILQNIDRDLKELKTLPARVERLERAVFK